MSRAERKSAFRCVRQLVVGLSLGLAACGESAPDVGAIRFATHVDGAASDLDPDGFQVSGLFETTAVAVSPGVDVIVDALPADEYELTLGDIAANCGAADGVARTVTVVPGDTVDVSWSLTCGTRPVTLTVGFATPDDAATGSIEVTIGDDPPVTLRPGEEIVFDHLAPGSFPLSITESPNCRVQGPRVQTVHLVSGAASVLGFQGACSPGRIVFDVAGGLWQVSPDGTGLSALPGLGASVAATPSVEVTGGRIVFAQNYSALAVTDWAATELTNLVSMDELESPAWSPDGSRIAFLAIDADTKTWDIHVIDRDGSNLRNITSSPYMEHRPTWTPDGGRIVFSVGSVDGAAIYSINPDGTDRDSLAEGSNPVPSPTGNTIAFFDGGMLRLMDGDGQNIRTVPESFNFSGSLSWSPDGRLLVFYAASVEHQGIATVDVSGRVRILVPQFDGMFFPTISWGR